MKLNSEEIIANYDLHIKIIDKYITGERNKKVKVPCWNRGPKLKAEAFLYINNQIQYIKASGFIQ